MLKYIRNLNIYMTTIVIFLTLYNNLKQEKKYVNGVINCMFFCNSSSSNIVYHGVMVLVTNIQAA